MRFALSTSVRAVNSTTPNSESRAPLGSTDTAMRATTWFPSHESSCGWYTVKVSAFVCTMRGQPESAGGTGGGEKTVLPVTCAAASDGAMSGDAARMIANLLMTDSRC